LRTHILVCVGAALITQISSQFGVNGDRIAAQIVTGVGFLGAGTILRNGVSGAVTGLTTAATLWAIAGVGMAVGYGGRYAVLAVISTVLIFFVLTLLNRFEDVLIRQRRRHGLTVVFAANCSSLDVLSGLLNTLREKNVKTRDLQIEKMADTEVAKFRVVLSRDVKRDDIDALMNRDTQILHYEWHD